MIKKGCFRPLCIVDTPSTEEPSPSVELPHVMEPPPKIPKTEDRPSFVTAPIVESPLNLEPKTQREADPPSSSSHLQISPLASSHWNRFRKRKISLCIPSENSK